MCVVHEVAHQGQVAVVRVHDVLYDVSRHDDSLLQDLLGDTHFTVSLGKRRYFEFGLPYFKSDLQNSISPKLLRHKSNYSFSTPDRC